MEPMAVQMPNSSVVLDGDQNGNTSQVDDFKLHVDKIFLKVDKLEQKLKQVEQFYSSTNLKPLSGTNSGSVENDKGRHIPGMRKQQQEAARREAVAAKRMQDLMRQFGSIFRQITQHKWAWPFMHPVDVEGLGLHDYYEVIDKPMDFSTIKNQMEAKDGTGYKHVRQICDDMRLVFDNAMKYNEEKSDVYRMAKTLLEKFEEKWVHFLPKVTEEEKRQEEEEALARVDMQLAKEAAHSKMTRDIRHDIYEVDMNLAAFRDVVVQKCRKISIEEKRKLGAALTRLSPDDLCKALEVVAQGNPGFEATSEEVSLDIDSLSESTLWRLKVFAMDVLENTNRNEAITGCDKAKYGETNDVNSKNNKNCSFKKRKNNIADAAVKTARKKTTKASS